MATLTCSRASILVIRPPQPHSGHAGGRRGAVEVRTAPCSAVAAPASSKLGRGASSIARRWHVGRVRESSFPRQTCGGPVRAAAGAAPGLPNEDVEAVLFDMDGVLCDSEDRSRAAAVALFAEMGYAVTPEDFIPFMGTGEANFLGGVAKQYGVPDFDPARAKERFFEIYISQYATPNSGLGYPGALDLVLQCKEAGLKVAVASSADRVKVAANLAASGLPITNFDAVMSADKFKNLKPAPDIFLAAAAALGVPASKCVVIEDAMAGVQAAAAAGMRCIAVTTTLSRGDLEAAGPALVRPDIGAISLTDILGLKAGGRLPGPAHDGAGPTAAAEGGTGAAGPREEQPAAAPQLSFFDEPITLPGGQVATRRGALRAASLLGGAGTVYFALTHLKALSYASPRALVNAVLGAASFPTQALAAGNQRVRELKKYIADIERRGGGATVPDFQKGLDWLNSAPLSLTRELKGKVVILDFWTYCCINCMHVLPDLAYLEKKYRGQPVAVVGVHSAKFDNEKDVGAIRNAVLRYDVTHPVVNDGDMTMWRALGVSSWPTLALVSPTGRLLGMLAGEGHREDLDDLLTAALEYYEGRGQLDATPVPEALEKDKDKRLLASPLRYPGKVATDLANGRLFISDSNHHRIVVTDLEGKFLTQVGGAGGEGLRDGPFDSAAFNRPQGVVYNAAKNVLYVADTENHALREVDFVTETVRTLAGDGKKGADYRGGRTGAAQELNSPWDVEMDTGGEYVYIAMAGQHQIWRHRIADGSTAVFSGSGYERNQNGRTGSDTAYAQPSGISLLPGGREMAVADSESSSVRAVDLLTGGSRLFAGGDPTFSDNLFQFGDRDGVGSNAQLQHPLGVLAVPGGTVYVADSYNHKIKVLDLRSGEVKTVAGTGKAGFQDGAGSSTQLSEPAGLAPGLDGKLYVGDTNNNVIRVLHTAEGNRLTTLDLSSVPAPAPSAAAPGVSPRRLRRRAPAEAELVRVGPVAADSGELQLRIAIPEGFHFTKGAKSRFEVDWEPEGAVAFTPSSGEIATDGLQATAGIAFSRPATLPAASARVNCKVYYCQQDEVCLYKAVTFDVALGEGADGTAGKVSLDYTVVPVAVNTKSFVTSR